MIKPQIAVLPLRDYRITILIKMNTIDAFRISSSNVINDFLRSSTRSSSVGFYKSMIKIRKTVIPVAFNSLSIQESIFCLLECKISNTIHTNTQK